MGMTMEPPKPTFREVFESSGWEYDDLVKVASRARVDRSTLIAMFTSSPVQRDEAESVLKVLSEKANRQDWTLETVDILVERGGKA